MNAQESMAPNAGFAAFRQVGRQAGKHLGSQPRSLAVVSALFGLMCALLLLSTAARAQGALVLYCSVEED